MTEQELQKDFATLQREAAADWADTMKAMTQRLAEQAEHFSVAPDVVMRPDPAIPWSYEGIVCHCGGESFLVLHWVTINGIKSRFVGFCTACQVPHTWDWQDRRWVD